MKEAKERRSEIIETQTFFECPLVLSSTCKACLGLRKATCGECSISKSNCAHQLAANQPLSIVWFHFAFLAFFSGVQWEQRPQEFDIQVSPVEDSPNACQLRVWLGTESCKSSGQCVSLLIHQLFAKRGESQKRSYMMNAYGMSFIRRNLELQVPTCHSCEAPVLQLQLV